MGVNACLPGPYLRFGAASYPERLLRFLPGGNLTQSAIGLTPFQASCDVGDVAEICMKRDKNICGFGHRQRLVTTGLKAERERAKVISGAHRWEGLKDGGVSKKAKDLGKGF